METSKKPKPVTKRQRELIAPHVLEYVDQYREMGKVAVDVSPCGTFAGVRKTQATRARKATT